MKSRSRMLKSGAVAATIFALFIIRAKGQEAEKPEALVAVDPVTAEVYSSRIAIAGGEAFEAAIHLSIDGEWHINSNAPLQDYLIPTEVQLEDSMFTIESIVYPKGNLLSFDFSPDDKLSVYGGDVWINLLIIAKQNIPDGEIDLPLALRWQACNNSFCLAPETLDLSFKITIDNSGEVSAALHDTIFAVHGISHEAPDESGNFKLGR